MQWCNAKFRLICPKATGRSAEKKVLHRITQGTGQLDKIYAKEISPCTAEKMLERITPSIKEVTERMLEFIGMPVPENSTRWDGAGCTITIQKVWEEWLPASRSRTRAATM